jgi:hypothetical protein
VPVGRTVTEAQFVTHAESVVTVRDMSGQGALSVAARCSVRAGEEDCALFDSRTGAEGE